LDWGVAFDLRRRPAPGTTPRPQVFGTPAYMAPEMAGGDPGHLDERTDVYLLGSALHEVLTGRPRHLGGTLAEVILAAYRSEAGGRECLIAVARFELDRENLAGAEALLAELHGVPPDLQVQLLRLRARRTEEKLELEGLRRLRHEADTGVGGRARAWATAGLF